MVVNYDFIVVGGGSSGSALASNLATKGPTLLIERGANHTAYPQSAVRQGWPQITVVAFEQVRNGGSGHWTGTANILGGGSAINGAACWRGEKSIFEALGFDLESVEDTFEYLEEHICTPNDDADTEYTQAFQEAWTEHGFEPIYSSSGYGSWANSSTASTIQRARSILPVTSKRRPASYLFEHSYPNAGLSVLSQGNLTVFLMTKAKRILFNDDKVAVGVEINSPAGDASIYIRNGGKVFLNAGAYETPKLLMLSGIGPADTLSKHEIPIVHENEAVGQNLIDRKEISILLPKLKMLKGDDFNLLDFAAISEHYWASMLHKHSTGWGNVNQGCATCDVEKRTPACRNQMLGAMILYGINRDFNDNAAYYIAQRRPLTRGNVTLASSNFNDLPVVHDGWSMNYEDLSVYALRDLEMIVDAVQDLAVDILRKTTLLEKLGHPVGTVKESFFSNELTAALSEFRTEFGAYEEELDQCEFSDIFVGDDEFCTSWDECVPSIPSLPSNNRQYLRDIVFRALTSSHHISGTCKAGVVVEEKTLSVIGVEGLYISDLSVVTQPVDIHPMMTAMSIGLLLGKSVDHIPTAEYETTPIILAVICIAVVALPLVGWMGVWIHKKKNKSQATPNCDNDVSIFDIWGNASRILDAPSKQDAVSEENNSYLMIWSNASCTYNKNNGKSKKRILFNNFGCMKEGEVTAIMGPSGSSKSTLLDILSGRKSVGAISGNFSFLGSSLEVSEKEGRMDSLSKTIQGVSAYIPQQEYFYPTQTCEEAIQFTANMKFGRGNPKERVMVVRACLNVVGLDAEIFASRKIGGELAGGVMIRGLSGGERKRLALACVLALKPKMLFIDELTSGLDSENAFLTIKLLKDLSVKMKVATLIIIHQPSPDTFALFDRLILLSKGRCLFSDLCSNLSSFYENNYDENVPIDTSIADDLVAKASIYDLSNEEERINFYERDEIDLSVEGESPTTMNKETAIDVDVTSGCSIFFKFSVVFRRNLVNQYIRNITNVGARLGSYSGLALIIGAVFWQVGITDSERGLNYEEANILLRSTLFLMNVSYLLPFSTIPVFFADKRFFAAESALGLYPTWMYCASQVLLEFLFLILTSTLEAAIVIPMCGLVNPTIPYAFNFLTITSILIASGLVGSTMVFCCCIWLPTQDLSFLAGSTVVTVSLSLCGGFLPFTVMPVIPRSLQWISPIKYSFQAMAMAQLKGTSSEKVIDIAGYNTPASISENVWILYGIFVFLSLLTAVGMSRVKEVR